jgi:hypothetical protein
MRYNPSLLLSLALAGFTTRYRRTTADDVAPAIEYPGYQI